jgi:hypothetical protein
MNDSSLQSAVSIRQIFRTICVLAVFLMTVTGLRAGTLFKFEFDEKAGTTVTNVEGTLTGTFGGLLDPNSYPVSSTDSPSGAAADKALTIVDPTGFLVADTSANTNFADFSKPLTVEAWVRIPETAAARAEGIVGFGNSWKLGFRPDGRLAFTMFGVVDATVDVFPLLGTWTHLAAVWDPGVGITYFVDGIEAGNFPETRPMRAAQNAILGIGSAGTGEPLNATIDRVRIHQALLTVEQLDSVAATPKAPLPQTLAAFDFNEAAAPYGSSIAVPLTTSFGQDFILGTASPKWSSDTPSKRASDGALEFDGNDRVRVEDPSQIVTLSTGDFTAQSWVKFGTLPGVRSVIFFNNGPGGAITMSVTSDRHLFVTTLGIADTRSAAVIPDDGLWHHVAVVHRNGQDLRFYVDGVLGDTIAYTGGVLMTRTDTFFVIGAEFTGGLPYRGLLDRVQLADEALTVEQLDYLAIPGVVPGAPELEIGTAVSVAWPTDATGFILESSVDLAEPRVWTVVGIAPVVVTDKFYVMLPTPAQKTFYRLVRPPSE